jgi:putative addiction module component (TIGR02574 family)
MITPNEIIEAALKLNPAEKAEVIDRLLGTLDAPDEALEKLWADEAERRIGAYERGDLKSVALETVLNKYR